MAEIRNHFGGGSMNRYSEILKRDEYFCTGKEKPFDAGPA